MRGLGYHGGVEGGADEPRILRCDLAELLRRQPDTPLEKALQLLVLVFVIQHGAWICQEHLLQLVRRVAPIQQIPQPSRKIALVESEECGVPEKHLP